jgi:hypothetical protein
MCLAKGAQWLALRVGCLLQCFTPIARTELLNHHTFHVASYLFRHYAAAPFLFLPCYMFHPSVTTRYGLLHYANLICWTGPILFSFQPT